ncbi:MAG: peptidylprolyl isomerase [Spirochaetota bacterium]
MAPAEFDIVFDTTKGTFKARVHREWAPEGADRLHELVSEGFFNDVAVFRMLDGFVAQFGISGDPEIGASWREKPIPDDPVKTSNTEGTISYAMAGLGTRTTQLFVNLTDNTRLDSMGFAPVAEVVEGMDVVRSLYGGYGEGAPRGNGPNQGEIQRRGNEYLREEYPDLDYVQEARIDGA